MKGEVMTTKVYTVEEIEKLNREYRVCEDTLRNCDEETEYYFREKLENVKDDIRNVFSSGPEDSKAIPEFLEFLQDEGEGYGELDDGTVVWAGEGDPYYEWALIFSTVEDQLMSIQGKQNGTSSARD
jgi:hypothetical protein